MQVPFKYFLKTGHWGVENTPSSDRQEGLFAVQSFLSKGDTLEGDPLIPRTKRQRCKITLLCYFVNCFVEHARFYTQGATYISCFPCVLCAGHFPRAKTTWESNRAFVPVTTVWKSLKGRLLKAVVKITYLQGCSWTTKKEYHSVSMPPFQRSQEIKWIKPKFMVSRTVYGLYKYLNSF